MGLYRTMILQKRALRLAYFTVFYNIIEGVVSILAGSLTGSIALVGFGLDSFMETFSGSVMIWRFRRHAALTPQEEERREKKSLRLVGLSFLLLALYVLVEAIQNLAAREMPQPTLWGIVIAIVSIVVMSFLFFFKYQTGKALRAKSLMADAKQTLACEFLSVTLLLGSGLNFWLGWWWADSAAALIIAVYLLKEGKELIE